METHCGNFGFRTFKFVGNEPWHIQPTEITASRKYVTTPPALYTWALPTDTLPIEPPVVPPSSTGVFSVDGYRKNVQQGSQGKMAKMCQQQINLIAGQGIAEDGNFGNQSVAALKNVQTVLGVTVDGKCGPQTWQAFENGIKTQADAGGWG
jgi:peptidoglycan hydrolase-like protein with peptidoglycan-binding domain